MNGNWSEDNRKRREREEEEINLPGMFCFHAPIFKPHPKR